MRLTGIAVLIALAIPMSEAASVGGAGDVEIRYETHGAGEPTIVFVHGWTCDRTYWREQIGEFARDFSVIAIDLGGHGESGDNRDDWSMAAFGADVAAVVETENRSDVVLVGHSMGGPVAIEAARRLGRRVRLVVAVDTLQEPAREPYTDEQSRELWARFSGDFAASVEGFVRQSFFLPGAPGELVDFVAKDMAEADPVVALEAGHALTTWSAPDGIAAIREIPFVLINADYRPTDETALRKLHPDATLVLMSGVGHFPMLVRPQEFNERLEHAIVTTTPRESTPGGRQR